MEEQVKDSNNQPLDVYHTEYNVLSQMEHKYKLLLSQYKRDYSIYLDTFKNAGQIDKYKGKNIKLNNKYYRVNKYGYLREYDNPDLKKRHSSCRDPEIVLDDKEQKRFQQLIDNDLIRKGFRIAAGEPCDLEGQNIELKEEIVRQIQVGSSGSNSKLVKLSTNGLNVSPQPVNPQAAGWGDAFSVKKIKLPFMNDMLTVTRTDANEGWGQDLILEGRMDAKLEDTFDIHVGKSDKNTVTVTLKSDNILVDPKPVNRQGTGWSDTFSTNVVGNILFVTRTDTKSGWDQDLTLKGRKKQNYNKLGYLKPNGEMDMYSEVETDITSAMNNGCPKNTVKMNPQTFDTFMKSPHILTFESNCSIEKVNNMREKLLNQQNELMELASKIKAYIYKIGKNTNGKVNLHSNIDDLTMKMKEITTIRNDIEHNLKQYDNKDGLLDYETRMKESNNMYLSMYLAGSLVLGFSVFKMLN